MIVDFDDFAQDNHNMNLLERLKWENPKFRCTLFAVPGLGTDGFWDSVPDWCELAMHGEFHPDPREAEDWSYTKAINVLLKKPARFVKLWKSPGWQISDGTYEALVELGWALADQPYNDHRRPEGLLVHRLGDGDHLHGHIQDIGSNGMRENWHEILTRVRAARSFEFISEVVQPWRAQVAA